MPKVVVVGDANVDIIVPYPRFLNEERTQVEYPQIGIEGGGTSANTAVALAKLGLDVSFVGTVGDDQYGRFVMQDFKDAGVDVTGLVADSTLQHGRRIRFRGRPRREVPVGMASRTAIVQGARRKPCADAHDS